MTGFVNPCTPDDAPIVGRDRPRLDSTAKVTGRAVYTVDIAKPGMLHAKVLRSPHAHARILSIDASAARSLPGVTAVVTREEITGLHSYGTYVKDQPIVATESVRYVGDVVAAVAAVDERTAFAALDLIRVEYGQLPAVFDVTAAMEPPRPPFFPTSLSPLSRVRRWSLGSGTHCPQRELRIPLRNGRRERLGGLRLHLRGHLYLLPHEHMHLEPFATVAEATENEIEVWTSTQSPFPMRKELARVFGLPENDIRVNVPLLGGGLWRQEWPKNGGDRHPALTVIGWAAGALLHEHRGSLPDTEPA